MPVGARKRGRGSSKYGGSKGPSPLSVALSHSRPRRRPRRRARRRPRRRPLDPDVDTEKVVFLKLFWLPSLRSVPKTCI